MSSDQTSNEASSGPAFSIALHARVGQGEVHFQSSSLAEVSRVMAFFNLVEPTAQAAAPAPAAVAGNADKKPKADKPKAEAPAPAPTAAAPAGTSSPAPAPAASAPSAPAGEAVTPAKAAEAVKAYGAKNGIEAARALLQKHGVAKTTEIGADKAAAIFAEATGAAPSTDDL